MVFCDGVVVCNDLLGFGNYREVSAGLQIFNAVYASIFFERFEDVLDVKVLGKFENVGNNLLSKNYVLRWKVGCRLKNHRIQTLQETLVNDKSLQ